MPSPRPISPTRAPRRRNLPQRDETSRQDSGSSSDSSGKKKERKKLRKTPSLDQGDPDPEEQPYPVKASTNCANCGAVEVTGFGPQHKPCVRCEVTFYCSTSCQKMHWQNGHKETCAPPSAGFHLAAPTPPAKSSNGGGRGKTRSFNSGKPVAGADGRDDGKQRHGTNEANSSFLAASSLASLSGGGSAGDGDDQSCQICLEYMPWSSATRTLPCGHRFHAACVDELKAMGVEEVCSPCRAEQLESAGRLFDDGYCLFFPIKKRLERGDGSWGPMLPRDVTAMAEAIQLWEAADKQDNHAMAQYNLGVLYDQGRGGVKQDVKQALGYWTSAAEQGNMNAQFNLGAMYCHGRGVNQNDELAFRFFHLAAEQGDAEAQLNVAMLYDHGKGVRRDLFKARRWYEKAAKQGDVEAQFLLGLMYHHGQGIQQSNSKAVTWWHRAAEQDHAEAQYNLGIMFETGKGVKKNYSSTAKWWQMAAEQGNIQAILGMGVICYQGRGVEQRYERALSWYTKAADLGDVTAMYNLGVMYKNGRGVKQSARQAADYFSQAAAREHPVAMFNLGILYFKGIGVKQSDGDAVTWLLQAAQKGVEAAGPAMDEIKRMASTKKQAAEQLRQARQQQKFENRQAQIGAARQRRHPGAQI